MRISYNNTLALIAAAMLLAIAVLALLLTSQGPRVRFVSFERDPADSMLTKNSALTIRFDRPLEQRDYSHQIQFTPEIEFNARTNAQTITLTLEDNFQRDTRYSLSIGPDIFDRSGKPMSAPSQQTFVTGTPSYLYLERNYGVEYDDADVVSLDANDHIKMARIGEEPEIIFSDPTIAMFAANSDYMVAAASRDDRDILFIIDMGSLDVQEVQLQVGRRINHLTLSPHGQVALYTLTPDRDAVSPQYFEVFANRVESINLEDGLSTILTNKDDDYLKAFSIQIDDEGLAALVQGQENTYYAASPFNDYDPVLIGSYDDSFGFSADGSEILFRNNTDFLRYEVASGETRPINFSVSGFKQSIQAKADETYVSSTAYFSGETQSYVNRFNSWDDDEPELLWTNGEDNQTLRSFSVNYDGSLLALQLNPLGCGYDQVRPNAQCESARTVIYDPKTRDTIADLRGFDLVWLP